MCIRSLCSHGWLYWKRFLLGLFQHSFLVLGDVEIKRGGICASLLTSSFQIVIGTSMTETKDLTLKKRQHPDQKSVPIRVS